MKTPGTFISSVGHVGLIGWLLVGWGLESEPLEFETMDVSVISGEAFNAILAAGTPEAEDTAPEALPQPVSEDVAPEAPEIEAEPEPTPLPEPVPEPAEETPPPTAPEPPQIAEVEDAAPAVPAPPVAPPSVPDEPISDTPTPRQADRIASVPTPISPPDANVEDTPVEQIDTSSAEPEEVVVEEQEATVTPEATTEIVTEAEEPSSAPETSMRPITRPTRPVQTAVADDDPEPEPEDPPTPTQEVDPSVDEDLLADVLAEVQADQTTPVVAAPTRGHLGSGLTSSEIGSVTAAIGQLWVADPGAQSSRITVVVAFSMNPDGTIAGDVRQVSVTDGPPAAQAAAFRAARSALFRTANSGGIPFPPDKYDQWENVEATFDPSGVRFR